MYIEPYKTREEALRAIRDAIVRRAGGRLVAWRRILNTGTPRYCALGAYALEAHGEPTNVVDEINPDWRKEVTRVNDHPRWETEEQRYERVVAWLNDQLGE